MELPCEWCSALVEVGTPAAALVLARVWVCTACGLPQVVEWDKPAGGTLQWFLVPASLEEEYKYDHPLYPASPEEGG